MKLSFPKAVVLAFFVVALTSIPAFATECVMPEACSSLAAKAAAASGATDPADYIKTWMFVNCDAQGYFVGAMQGYQSCLATKAAEEKKAQEEAEKKRLEEAKKNEEAKKAGKPYVTKVEFGKDVKAGDLLKAKRNETIIITYADGAKVILEPGASMKITSESLVLLLRGKIQFLMKDLKGMFRKEYQYKGIPWAMAVRGTEFLVDVKPTCFTLWVLDGIVDVYDLKGENTIEVKAGYSVVARKNGKIPKLKKFDPKKLGKWYEAATENVK